MSLLHQETPELLDDAARGEAFTKGTSPLVWAAAIAALVVSAAIAIYVLTGEKPPAAAGQVTQVWVHPMHTQTAGYDANGEAQAQESFDQVLVLARMHLENHGKTPLFLQQIECNTTLDDGIHTSTVASASDYERLFVAYPALKSLHGQPIPGELTLEAGAARDGDVVAAFRMSRADWQKHKDLSFTLNWRYQPQQLLKVPEALIQMQ